MSVPMEPMNRRLSLVPSDGRSSLIVVGVDGSAGGWRALHYAIGIQGRQNGRLLAVHAVHIPAYALVADDSLGMATDAFYHSFEGMQEGIGQIADEVRAIGRDTQADIEYVWVNDNPITALVRTASAYHADLVVVGRSERFKRRRLLGSVEFGVLRSCGCPVTVVP